MTYRDYYQEARDEHNERMSRLSPEALKKECAGKSIPAATYLGLEACEQEDYKEARKYFEKALKWYEAQDVVSAVEDVAYAAEAYYFLGLICLDGLDGEEPDPEVGAAYIILALVECSYYPAREMAGLMCYEGLFPPDDDSTAEQEAMKIWKEGMDEGDRRCTFRWCATKVENEEADEEVIGKLKALAQDEDDPIADAAAVLYSYYWAEGMEDEAWKWRDKAEEMESPLMQALIDEEAEEEVGEDDWTQPEQEFEAFDDETEAETPAASAKGYVIIADTNDGFSIVEADASDWRSLPAFIGANRCDDMRCQKFRDVAHKLMLPGTLLGQLDKEAFMKPDLELNYHASQWYDGMADLAGDMVICMEDNKYNPFSFSSKEQAQSVIDALCNC